MYGNHRFLHDNYITASDVTASSMESGVISGAKKIGTGDAGLTPSGAYTGTEDKIFYVEIDGIGGGTQIGQATFKWKTLDSGSWAATGVTTDDTPPIALQDGVSIAFVDNGGTDFALADNWTFRAVAAFAPTKMFDGDRDTVWAAAVADTSCNLVLDLGSPLVVDALIIADHTITTESQLIDIDGRDLIDIDDAYLVTGAGTITVQMNATNSWGSPSVSNEYPATDPFVVYPTEAGYRYVRIVFAESLGNIQVGSLFLGGYEELSGNADWGSSENLEFILETSQNPFGVDRATVHAERRGVALNYDDADNDDLDAIKAIYRASFDPEAGQRTPIWCHLFADEDDTMMLATLAPAINRTFTRYLGNRVALQLTEVVKTRA